MLPFGGARNIPGMRGLGQPPGVRGRAPSLLPSCPPCLPVASGGGDGSLPGCRCGLHALLPPARLLPGWACREGAGARAVLGARSAGGWAVRAGGATGIGARCLLHMRSYAGCGTSGQHSTHSSKLKASCGYTLNAWQFSLHAALKCWAFNPPGGTLSWNLSRIAQEFCTRWEGLTVGHRTHCCCRHPCVGTTTRRLVKAAALSAGGLEAVLMGRPVLHGSVLP